MDGPDWKAMEADYLASGLSYAALAEKWGVKLSALRSRASREGWGRRRRALRHLELSPSPTPAGAEEAELLAPAELALELRVQRSRRMIEATDAMMDRVLLSLEQLEPDNTYALAMLVRSLKELREMQGLNKSALDLEEQRARIDKLKSEIRRDERESREPLVIEFVDTEGAEV